MIITLHHYRSRSQQPNCRKGPRPNCGETGHQTIAYQRALMRATPGNTSGGECQSRHSDGQLSARCNAGSFYKFLDVNPEESIKTPIQSLSCSKQIWARTRAFADPRPSSNHCPRSAGAISSAWLAC